MILKHWKAQVVLLLIFSFFASYATGYAFNVFEAFRDVWVGSLGTFSLLLVISSISPRIAEIILKIFIITTTIYFPIGWLYGSPTFKVIGGLLETDAREATEFLGFLPPYVWFLQLLYLIFGALVWKFLPSLFNEIKNISKKWLQYLRIITAITLCAPLITNQLTGAKFQDDESTFPVSLVGFYIDLISAPYIYWNKKQRLLHWATIPPTWQIKSVNPKYKNHVIIIGESERKDYLNVYGFPFNNTPFLSKSNGVFIDGYISAGEYTMISLEYTLSQSMKGASNNNIISLAEEAGFDTAWLSNQGMLGFFSNEVSSYAARSDYSFFTQRGDWQKSIGMSDRMLLPQLDKILQQPTQQPRLIVMHIMGSHSDFCKRLDNGILLTYKNQSMSCYVSTIRQTDSLIQEVITKLKQQNESYSLIYFSDHGLKHHAIGTNQETLTHGGDTYHSYEVPLIKLSSDDTNHTLIKTQRSAFNFLHGFSQWLGITTQEFDNNYDFFGNKPDSENTGNLRQVNSLPKDPIKP